MFPALPLAAMIDGDAIECHITAAKEAQFEVSFAIRFIIRLVDGGSGQTASRGAGILDCRVEESRQSLCHHVWLESVRNESETHPELCD